MSHERFSECLEACNDCAAACDHCATACLTEPDVAMMVECIRIDRDCSDICRLAAAWMARDSRFVHQLCELCAAICDACGAECAKHATEHCRACAEACRRCAERCREMPRA
jgi:hypothetical protein